MQGKTRYSFLSSHAPLQPWIMHFWNKCQVVTLLVQCLTHTDIFHPGMWLAFAFCKVKFANFFFKEPTHNQSGWWKMCASFSRWRFRREEKSIKGSFPGNVNRHNINMCTIRFLGYMNVTGSRIFLCSPLLIPPCFPAAIISEMIALGKKSSETTGWLHRIGHHKLFGTLFAGHGI